MSQPGLARLEQFLSCSRTSGRLRRSGQEPNLASSTSMWSQSCSMMWNLEDDKDNATENPDILQHLSPAHLQHLMARDDPKWRAVGVSGTATSSKTNSEEKVGLDLTHPQEASIQHHTPSSDLEAAGKEEERPASQQLGARHWGRAQAARYKLDRCSKISPEQSAMARGHQWPMLHVVSQAWVSKGKQKIKETSKMPFQLEILVTKDKFTRISRILKVN